MGCGSSSPEAAEAAAASRAIEKELREAQKEAMSEAKLLLLGSASAGKSTFAKQFRILFLGGFSASDLLMYKDQVFFCIWRNMRILGSVQAVKQSEEFANNCTKLSQGFLLHEARMDDFASYVPYLKRMWEMDIVKRAADENRSMLDYSIRYFMSHIDRIGTPDYLPSVEDVLHVKTKTLGIVEIDFFIKSIHVRMVDVGGQKNERRKWIHAFQDVAAVVFVVALTDFSEVLEEDGTTNRMKDSLQLFNQVINNRWLSKTNVILFLNKTDLFADRILNEQAAFAACFPRFKAPESEKELTAAGIACVKDAFLAEEQNAGSRILYSYETCATDTACVQRVFEAVSDIFLTKNLETFI